MAEQQNLTDVGSTREAYSAPDYRRFTFETSDLLQTSDQGNIGGDAANNVSSANEEW